MGSRNALIIANNTYVKLNPLDTPRSDADAIERILSDKEIGNFNVTKLVNQPAQHTRIQLERFFGRGPDDLLVLCYLGHGLISNPEGKLYLAATDTEQELLNSTGISSEFIVGLMDHSLSKSQILILDCCFGGAFVKGVRAKDSMSRVVLTEKTFEPRRSQLQGSGRIVLAASTETQYAFDQANTILGDSTHSLFTHFLIQGLETGEARDRKHRFITPDSLFDYIYEQMVKTTDKQHPQKISIGAQQGVIRLANSRRTKTKSAQTPILDITSASEPAAPKSISGFTLPLLEFCDIPAGTVSIESGFDRKGWEYSAHYSSNIVGTYNVQPFAIAKYPTTYRQFQIFLDDPHGYRNEAWWDGLAQRNRVAKPQHWPFNSHPRENVNWYEAIAFTRWLSENIGLKVTLPTEAQWQRAAQGDDNRIFPWGDNFDVTRCNVAESNTGQTTPVDHYPNGASPYGVMDMAGNLWEWCLSIYEYPYVYPETTSESETKPRALHGGSWMHKYHNARAGCRTYDFAESRRDDGIGFRVVVIKGH